MQAYADRAEQASIILNVASRAEKINILTPLGSTTKLLAFLVNKPCC